MAEPAPAPAPAQQVPVPEVQEINLTQPSAADLTAAIPFMGRHSTGQTIFFNNNGKKIRKWTVVELIRNMFIEYAENPAADPQTGISWASPQNSPTVQRVLERMRVPKLAVDTNHAHGYEQDTYKTIKNRK